MDPNSDGSAITQVLVRTNSGGILTASPTQLLESARAVEVGLVESNEAGFKVKNDSVYMYSGGVGRGHVKVTRNYYDTGGAYVNILPGSSDYNPGHLIMSGGEANTGIGGRITVTAGGSTYGDAGSMYLYGGSSLYGTGGNVTIRSGSGYAGGQISIGRVTDKLGFFGVLGITQPVLAAAPTATQISTALRSLGLTKL